MLSDRQLRRTDTICHFCMERIWPELLYYWRESLKPAMPDSVKNRPDCWYGKECKTQATNLVHAQKYNHICPNLKKKIGNFYMLKCL